MRRFRPSIAAWSTGICSLIFASCAITPDDYKPVTDSTEFGPHTYLRNMYYCGSDAQNHYFAREMRPLLPGWHPSTHYFKIDRKLVRYTQDKPFSPKRSQWETVVSEPRFLHPAPSAWPIPRSTSSTHVPPSPHRTN